MLRYEKLTKENLDLATEVQNKIFPDENGKKNFIDSIGEHIYRKELIFWIVFKEKNPIGIIGLYAYHEYPEDGWMGWYGVLPEQTGKGYGSEVFDFFENYAKENRYKNIRLYTDELDNEIATKLYYKKGMISEVYKNKDDVFYEVSNTLIFSKSLTDQPVEKWNNKYLGLNEQEKRQKYKE
ncbi:MAG: hypothetical protein A2Y24_02025 [Clostridiales bacterium GWE2_32_10]|nr:MAG: hypothetical protein A2Y24_02025 [Clostridiales bacterium GWE2_32_10]HBY20179.1 hypothetical protein [Clostridiales bacterium]